MKEIKVSTKANLLIALRENAGKPVSGSVLADAMGISRVAVWKGIQSLVEAGYPVETSDSGYALDPGSTNDFLYPWEFGENESMFHHMHAVGSTMDKARELAGKNAAMTVVTADRQSDGRGRNGRSWISRQGGLFCTILHRTGTAWPGMAVADYCLPVMLYQIVIARVLGSVCGKPARLRWPNDIYIGRRKIAGILTDIAGEGDSIQWFAVGIGVNIHNQVHLEKTVSCAGITGNPVSRREVLLGIIGEAEKLRAEVSSGMAYAQGNRLLAAEWNAIADNMSAKAAVITVDNQVLAKGIFAGIDPAGRCIIKSESSGAFYFNPGPASVVFLSGRD
jgi:BirA family biotin operon repressor/biotin-[acetyl-CoA-carboxylase] ligase